jgi:type IV pilus assembly protein PilE
MMRISRNRACGLTLVELMVVVAVLAVLAGIAYPIYTNQTQKARRADAKIALENIALAQERFYTINGSYTANLSSLQVSDDIQLGDSDDGYYDITLAFDSGNDQTFTVTAQPDSSGSQAGDGCSTFTIDHLGVKASTGSESNCW